MKTFIYRLVLPSAVLTALMLATGCSPQNVSAETQTSAPPAVVTNSVATALESVMPSAPIAVKDITPPVTPAALPPNIPPASPLAQVIRLTQAGVDQSIIMTFVTNSSHTFNLDSDKIIYLTDLGAPTDLVTAIMDHDQQLQNQFTTQQAAQQAQQIQPAETALPPEPAPANTADVAVQTDTQPAPVTVDSFNDTLQPYGNWVVINGYGRCWQPTVVINDSSWQPYCNRGRWVYSDCGWYWNSDYAWGATFHYGRWFRAPNYGWCWYPDNVWAPSWVTWRYSNNYCGWAPLPPRTTYQAGVGIVYNGGGVSVGFGFGLGANCFSFVPTRYFCSPNPRNYCVAPGQVTQVYNNTTVINNFNVNNRKIVNNGIAVGNIATATHVSIHQVPVRDIHGGGVRDGHSQPANHFGNAPGANHDSFSGNNPRNPSRTDTAGPNRTPSANHNQPVASNPRSQFNNTTDQRQPIRNPVVATIPPRSTRQPDSRAPVAAQNQIGTSPNRNVAPANNFAQANQNRTRSQTTSRPYDIPNITTPQRNPATVTAPYRPATLPPSQMPVANNRQQTASPNWQQMGTPRNYTAQPNRTQNPAVVAQSQSAPQTMRNNSQPQQGYRSAGPQSRSPVFASAQPTQGGNQRGPGR